MSKVAIMTDSNSGITQAEGKKLGITVIPMPFTIDGEEYFEDINLTQEEFYNKLTAGANVSTSQPSIGVVMSTWDKLLENYDEIVFIPMSSGLSQTCASSLMASSEDDYKNKVFVVDNQRISVTQRQSVLDAIELSKKGYGGNQIKEILEAQKMNSDIFIMVDTLKYLKKGGRITPAAAAIGTLLKIKPILLIKGEKLDKYHMLNRSIGAAKKTMLKACKECINGYMKQIDQRTDNVHIQLAYTGTDKTEILKFIELLEKEFPGKQIICQPLSLSVSCHIGTGAIGMAVTKETIIK